MNTHSFFCRGAFWGCVFVASSHAYAGGEEEDGRYRFAVHENPYALVWVERVVPPERVAGQSSERCTVLLGVNSKGEKTAWPQDCSEPAAAASLDAARQWVYTHGDVRPGELYARFHVDFVFPADGEAFVQIPWHILETPPEVYADQLIVRSELLVRERRAVELSSTLRDAHPRPHTCSATVALSSNGAPRTITEVACPEAWTPSFLKSLRKWRWEKLRENGEPFEASTRVDVTFR